MSKMQTLTGCFLVALCVSGSAAASASAAPPEVGRCQKVEPVQEGKKARYHGAYTNRACTKPSATDSGKFEWASGPGTDKTFTAVPNHTPTFETTGGKTVQCQSGEFKGAEYTGAKTEKFSGIKLVNCVNPAGRVCQTNPEDSSVIEDVAPVEGELGVVAGGASPTVGWDLKDVLFVFVCADEAKTLELGEDQVIEGSVIGVVRKSASDLNKMSGETQIEFEQAGGKQLPEAFEGGAKDTLTNTRLVGTDNSTEQMGLSARESDTYGEPLEIRTVE